MELGSPLALNFQLVGFNAIVVKDLKVHSVAVFVEAGHDATGGGETVVVLAGLE